MDGSILVRLLFENIYRGRFVPTAPAVQAIHLLYYRVNGNGPIESKSIAKLTRSSLLVTFELGIHVYESWERESKGSCTYTYKRVGTAAVGRQSINRSTRSAVWSLPLSRHWLRPMSRSPQLRVWVRQCSFYGFPDFARAKGCDRHAGYVDGSESWESGTQTRSFEPSIVVIEVKQKAVFAWDTAAYAMDPQKSNVWEMRKRLCFELIYFRSIRRLVCEDNREIHL